MTCCECGEEIVTLKGSAREIICWEQDRTAGGTNQAMWKTRTGRIMCGDCVRKRKYGAVQESLV